MTDTSPGQLIETLAATPAILAELVAASPPAAFDRAWPGEWSPRTVLAHLRDDEFMVMRLRTVRMLVEERPVLMPFDERRWAQQRSRSRDELPELLADFTSQRTASIQILHQLEPGHWERMGYQPEYGELSIASWSAHWVTHDQEHIHQIRAGLGLGG